MGPVYDPPGGPKGRRFYAAEVQVPPRLPQIQKDHRPVFVTFTTDHRWCLRENNNKFDLHTAVLMPDHTHLLLSPLRDVNGWNFSLPQIMHAIKGVSAWKVNVLLGRSGPVWQEEFFDHVVGSNDSLAEKAD